MNREIGKNVINLQNDSIQSIEKAILKSLKRKKYRIFQKEKIYGNGNASTKIVRILERIILNKQLIQKQISY